jgi:hypothetical protein
VIIRCHICHADPCGRWKQPPAIIFHDPYGQSRAAPNGFVYACREHLSATREGEIQERKKDHWPKGGLR